MPKLKVKRVLVLMLAYSCPRSRQSNYEVLWFIWRTLTTVAVEHESRAYWPDTAVVGNGTTPRQVSPWLSIAPAEPDVGPLER